MTEADATAQAAPQINVLRIYLKDASFESPKVPQLFTQQQQLQPQVRVDLDLHPEQFGDTSYEVVIDVTVTASQGEDTLFLVEVRQAGIFDIRNVPPEHMPRVLAVTCPEMLFPFARQVIADLAQNGGLPQLLIAPVSFDALYRRHQARQQPAAEGRGGEQGGTGSAPAQPH